MQSVPRCRVHVAHLRSEAYNTVVKYQWQEASLHFIMGGQLRTVNKCGLSVTFCGVKTFFLLSSTIRGGVEEICLSQ